MSKKILRIEYDFNFTLIGISSTVKEYRLCWYLNNELHLEFSRLDDRELLTENNELSLYVNYHYAFENLETEYHLISNRGSAGLLVPEQKETDYFLVANLRLSKKEERDLLAKLNKIKVVQAAFLIEPETLKSKENLLFV